MCRAIIIFSGCGCEEWVCFGRVCSIFQPERASQAGHDNVGPGPEVTGTLEGTERDSGECIESIQPRWNYCNKDVVIMGDFQTAVQKLVTRWRYW